MGGARAKGVHGSGRGYINSSDHERRSMCRSRPRRMDTTSARVLSRNLQLLNAVCSTLVQCWFLLGCPFIIRTTSTPCRLAAILRGRCQGAHVPSGCAAPFHVTYCCKHPARGTSPFCTLPDTACTLYWGLENDMPQGQKSRRPAMLRVLRTTTGTLGCGTQVGVLWTLKMRTQTHRSRVAAVQYCRCVYVSR